MLCSYNPRAREMETREAPRPAKQTARRLAYLISSKTGLRRKVSEFKCLLCKHEGLCFIPKMCSWFFVLKVSMVGLASNHRPRKAEKVGSLGFDSQPIEPD